MPKGTIKKGEKAPTYMEKASPYISMSVSQTKKGLLTQEINKESSKKIYKKWTLSTFDLSN